MKILQVTLEGFDASTDKTDHLIKWIAITKYFSVAWVCGFDTEEISQLCIKHWGRKEVEIEILDNVSFDDNGIDMVITNTTVFVLPEKTVFVLPEKEESYMNITQVYQTTDGTTFTSKEAAELYQKRYEAVQATQMLKFLIKEDFRNQNDQRDVLDFIVNNKTVLIDFFKEL